MKRREYASLCLAIIMILALSFSVFADYAVSTKPQGTYGGTTIDTHGEISTYNNIVSSSNSDTQILIQVFEGLTNRHGVTTEVIPVLAKSWEFSDNDTTVVFHLREDVYWHDGKEFTADDVIFTLDVIYDESIVTSNRDVLTFGGEPIKYKKIDKYTVEMKLPRPVPSLLTNLPLIMPKHKLFVPWQKGVFMETWGLDTPVKEIVGTGPFKIVQYKPGERVVLGRNDNYWKKDPSGKALPYLDRWVKQIQENRETEALMFENGDTDWLNFQPVDFDRMKAGEEKGNYTVYNGGPTFGTLFVTFNQNPNNPMLEEEPWKYEWFTNLHFRRAVAYAVDKDTMINQIYAGRATPLWSNISSANKAFHNPDVKKYPFNFEKAKEELRAGGFDWNEAGELIDKDGRVVEFTMTTNAGNQVRETALTIFANDLAKLGMKVHASPVDFNKLVSQLMSEFDWDAIIIGLTGGVEPNTGANIWKSSGTLHMWNPRQETPATEWEARVDELYDLGNSVMDPAQRKVYYDEAQELIAENLPLIYMVTQDALMAIRNKLQNVEYTSYGGVTWNIEELFIK